MGVLAQLTKGSTAAEDLAPIVGVIHLLLARFSIRVWWEYVDSAANPSDGLSRLFARDPFSLSQGWLPLRTPLPPWQRGWKASRGVLEKLCKAPGA